jgi:hypothetical protein
MNDTIFELKIKSFWIKADKKFLSISNKKSEIVKVSYKQITAITKWTAAKISELANSSEIKKLEK